MTAQNQDTAVGVFQDREKAREAVQALKRAGFTEEAVGLIRSHEDDGISSGLADQEDDTGEKIGGGAIAGAATGAGLGALWGLGILSGILPGIGPAIAGGTLGILLSSAAAGAAAAGLAGALIGMGLSHEEADYYESEVKSGRTIVTVHGSGRGDEALRVLRQYGAYDITNRGTAAMKPGAAYPPNSHPATLGGKETTGSTTLQAHERKLRGDKTPVETGEGRMPKEVQTEHTTLDVPVNREEIVTERRPRSDKSVSPSDAQEKEM